jgi:Domain of unknown function (DUF892)
MFTIRLWLFRRRYGNEKQIIKALPKMIKAATYDELTSGFQEHLEQTREHAERLEKILSGYNQTTRGPKCKGMDDLCQPDALGRLSRRMSIRHAEEGSVERVLDVFSIFHNAWAARIPHLDQSKLPDVIENMPAPFVKTFRPGMIAERGAARDSVPVF